jgi:hypothetical protein
MKAELILKDKIAYGGGYIQEMIIWKVPSPVEGSKHNYKYRLFYGVPGTRIVGYDNERPKGDHRHYEDQEENYSFSSVQQLITDFLNDVEHQRENLHE